MSNPENKAAALDPRSTHNRLIAGERLFNRNRMVEAEQIFRSLLLEDSENKQALNNLGVIAYRRGDLEKASRYFRDVLKLDPVDQDAIDNLSLVHRVLNQRLPWKLYASPGVIHHAENAREMLKLGHYIPSLHYHDPVWFFGMYFDQDFLQVLAHQGRKIINWRGSDALQLMNSPWRKGILKEIEALHVCQSERQQNALRELGLDAVIRPMLNTDPNDISLIPLPKGPETRILVFWRRGIDAFIQANMFFSIASSCPGVIFHIVGDENPERFSRPGRENIKFHGFLDEEALHGLMDQCKGTIRPWISDGTPNIQTKMLLKGRYAAHSCKFEKVAQCQSADEYVEWLSWLETVTQPNRKAREWWLRNLNNFDFLNPEFNL